MLKHLTFLGSGVEPATIEFGPGLNVIYGASDTGKSFILDAILFMLGAPGLRSIPEAQEYATVLLGIEVNDGPYTLTRSTSGGTCRGYLGLVKEIPDEDPVLKLSPKHSAGRKDTISGFLLSQINLDGRMLRKNVRNDLVSLSFRNIAHLSIVDETQMVSVAPPFFTGQVVTKTAELSTLRLLLDGDDDSLLVPEESDEARRISRGKREVLQQVLGNLSRSIEGAPEPPILYRQLALLDGSIMEYTQSLEASVSQRDVMLKERERLLEEARRNRRARARADELIARFGLLMRQYDSDLARLNAVQETGTLLSLFKPGVCVFCGAAVEHQVMAEHTVREAADFAASVAAEREKTEELRRDLVGTVEDLREQRQIFEEALLTLESSLEAQRDELTALDEQLRPREAELSALLSKKAEIERFLAVHAQIADIQDLAFGFDSIPAAGRTQAPARWPSDAALEDLAITIREMLEAWQVLDSGSVEIDKHIEDLVVSGEPRSARGKGMRSILHAAFTASFAKHALDRNAQHPGFVVLDSPLVTFREPDAVPEDGKFGEDVMSHSVHAAFYRYLDASFDGQAIVMENTTPPPQLSPDAVVVKFTKRRDRGRYGFFPQTNLSAQGDLSWLDGADRPGRDFL
ncbi:AAA family ATPase [Micromonospora echinofusca]|uniref:AAA family ATPase n=1 Tax=Micromonospora echinofusca TaxID=47858 RepID=UPI00340E4A1A